MRLFNVYYFAFKYNAKLNEFDFSLVRFKERSMLNTFYFALVLDLRYYIAYSYRPFYYSRFIVYVLLYFIIGRYGSYIIMYHLHCHYSLTCSFHIVSH